EHRWDEVAARCRRLAAAARTRLADVGLEPLAPDDSWLLQMTAAVLPDGDGESLQQRLYGEDRIEAPIGSWRGRCVLRASFQAYNDEADLDTLVEALASEL